MSRFAILSIQILGIKNVSRGAGLKSVNLVLVLGFISIFGLVSATILTFAPSAAVGKPLASLKYPPKLTAVSLQTAQALYHEVATDPEIPWDYPDGCYAKAEMADIFLEQIGVIAGKVFVKGQIYNTSHWGESFWLFHVAPLIVVKVSGAVRPYIIDPFLSKKLVSYAGWLALVKKNPNTVINKIYFTNRFVYGPQKKYLNFTHYDTPTLEDMQTVLQQIRIYLAGYSKIPAS